jgi:hypothetical protein
MGCNEQSPKSCNNVPQRPIGGLDWWEMVREKWGTAFFPALPHVLRLLAEGRPVTLDRLATVSPLPVHDIEAAFRQQVKKKRGASDVRVLFSTPLACRRA